MRTISTLSDIHQAQVTAASMSKGKADLDEVNYDPSPTGVKFHADIASKVRYWQGCVGGGKTSAMMMEILFTGLRQMPDRNGRRSTRWVIIRSTYAELKSTCIKTWEYWFGGMSTVVYDTPIRGTLIRTLPDGTTLDIEVYFLALESDQDVKKLRSLEVTGGAISEASETPESILTMLLGRIGRFPKIDKNTGYGPTWSGVLMESNPPHSSSWICRVFEKDRPQGFKIFRQPPPLLRDETVPDTAVARDKYKQNPDAENLDNLPNGIEYYYTQLLSASQEYINVYILGLYGTSFSGKPVYGQFSRAAHVSATDLVPISGYDIIVGMDFGMQSAAVFTQMTPSGVLMILDEVEPQDCTLEEFMNQYFMPLRQSRFRNSKMLVIGDPAGEARSSLAVKTAIQTVRSFGIAAQAASTNDPVMRVEAVAKFLDRRGGMLTDPRCDHLITGFLGGYCFAKRKGGGTASTTYQDKPDKGRYSHAHDALQYACLYHRGGLTKKTRHISTAKPRPFLYA